MKKLTLAILAIAICFAMTAGTTKASKKTVVKKERATFKHFNENDPKTTADNTITVVKEGKEVDLRVHEKWNNENLSPFTAKDVNMTSHYDPMNGDFVVTDVEPFTE